MRNIYNEELDILWDNYDNICDSTQRTAILKLDNDALRRYFTLNYKDLFYQVKTANLYKPRNQMKYNLLKLRRLLALWVNNNIITLEGGISYSVNDPYKQFPLFRTQSPKVIPTIKTINKLRVKALVSYAKDHNIQDFRQLRMSLIKNDFSNAQVNFLTDLYKKMQARSEMNNYSEKGKDFV